MDANQPENLQSVNNSYHPHRRGGFFRFFIGLSLVFIGVLYFLQSVGYLQGVDISLVLGKLWPVLIIFFGLSIVSGSGKIAYAVCVIIAIAIAAFVMYVLMNPLRYQNTQKFFSKNSVQQNIYQPIQKQ